MKIEQASKRIQTIDLYHQSNEENTVFPKNCPTEVFCKIFSDFDANDLAIMSLVTKEFYLISNDEYIWESLIKKKFGSADYVRIDIRYIVKQINKTKDEETFSFFKKSYQLCREHFLTQKIADENDIVANFQKMSIATQANWRNTLGTNDPNLLAVFAQGIIDGRKETEHLVMKALHKS